MPHGFACGWIRESPTWRSILLTILPPPHLALIPQTETVSPVLPEYERQMILAGRTNLLVPGLNFGVEIPVGRHFLSVPITGIPGGWPRVINTVVRCWVGL